MVPQRRAVARIKGKETEHVGVLKKGDESRVAKPHRNVYHERRVRNTTKDKARQGKKDWRGGIPL